MPDAKRKRCITEICLDVLAMSQYSGLTVRLCDQLMVKPVDLVALNEWLLGASRRRIQLNS